MGRYSKRVKLGAISRMIGPLAMKPEALSGETGITSKTLSLWLEQAGNVSAMDTNDDEKVPPAEPRRRPEDWPAEEKLRVLGEAARLEGAKLGALLRREGLHEADLAEWRATALASLGPPPKRPRSGDGHRIRTLERELRRKDKALAETAALLVLQGKVRALWGGEGDDTKPKSGR